MDDSLIVPVALGHTDYDVVITRHFDGLGARVRQLYGARRVLVVTDTHVAPLWLDGLAAELDRAGLSMEAVIVPAGEANKHRDTWWRIVDGALSAGIDRRTPLLALGGGVVGDLAGFAAASILRGVPFVQVPTTLLAMVDSSVGGKTGFNHKQGKNLVGAFHQPGLVWAATETLKTLEPRDMRAGLGEVVKSALIASSSLFERLESLAPALRSGDPQALREVIGACVRIKAEVVAADERESGWRAILNAGHTIGHGLERVLGYGELLHGEAVAMGLVVEARWAVSAGYCDDPELPERLERLVGALGLPVQPPETAPQAMIEAMGVDKKTRGDILTIPVSPVVGTARLVSLAISRLPELVSELP